MSYYGNISCMAVEPLEKKPIYHFALNARVLSVGGWGCSFYCEFCQNNMVSQSKPKKNNYFSASAIKNIAKRKKVDGICFTYNEPLYNWRFVKDVFDKCLINNLLKVIKTNAFCDKSRWEEVLELSDAINIDIKGDSKLYRSVCKISIDDYKIIMRNLVMALEASIRNKVHLELSIPIYPLEFSDNKWVINLLELLSNYPRTPVHLLKIFPAFQTTSKWSSSNINNMIEIKEKLSSKMDFVYLQNVFSDNGDKYRDTYDPETGDLLIKRNNMQSSIINSRAYKYLKRHELNNCSSQK